MALIRRPVNENELKDRSFVALPKGTYKVVINSFEEKESNKSPGNFYYKLELEVIEGEFCNRTIPSMITSLNSSETAQAIGDAELKQLLRSCDISYFNDTDQLIGKILMANVDIEKKPQEGYDPRNIVKKYFRCETGPKPVIPGTAPAQPTANEAPSRPKDRPF